MIRLLHADLSRMWRSKVLWVCAACAFLSDLANTVLEIALSNWKANTDGVIIDGFQVAIFIVAIFATLFIGTDYSDNTVRNKLIIGSTRTQIYFANLFTVIVGGLVITAAGAIVSVVRCIVVGKQGLTMEPAEFALGIAVCVCAMISSCAFFTLMGMLFTKKSSAVVWALFITVLAYFAAAFIGDRLREEEMVYGSYIDEATGEFTEMHLHPNSSYISGTPRVILSTVYNVLSFGDITQVNLETDNIMFLPLYSLTAAAVTTAAGVAVFRRKNIK